MNDVDPNETLKVLLQEARMLLDGNSGPTDFESAAESMAEGLVNLDEWIRKGGFLPARWVHRHCLSCGDVSLDEQPVCSHCRRNGAYVLCEQSQFVQGPYSSEAEAEKAMAKMSCEHPHVVLIQQEAMS